MFSWPNLYLILEPNIFLHQKTAAISGTEAYFLRFHFNAASVISSLDVEQYHKGSRVHIKMFPPITYIIWTCCFKLKCEKRTKMDGAPLFFCGVHVAQSLVFCVVFCRSLFVLFPFGHCIVCPFFNLQLQIIPLEPSIFSLSKLAIFYVINCSKMASMSRWVFSF